MKPHIVAIALLAVNVLSGCFLSDEPNIKTGTPLARGPVAFCTPDDPPCRIGVPSGDGYSLASDEAAEEEMRLRFELLTEAGGVPVYLWEAELRSEDETAWSYVVARPTSASVDGAPRFEMAMPACSDIGQGNDPPAGIERVDAYACAVTDYKAFRQYLLDNYAEEFADPAWWSDGN